MHEDAKIKTFKGVCNAWQSIGIYARHGRLKNQSSGNMVFDEAYETIRAEIKKYIKKVYFNN